MNQEGGYIRLYRRLWDNPVFRDWREAAVFAWMLSTAQWRPTTIRTKYGPAPLGTGELIIAERELAERAGVSRDAIRSLLYRMESNRMIALDRNRISNRMGTVLRILNYAEYQGVGASDDGAGNRNPTTDQPETNHEATATPPQGNRNPTKNKEGNKGKEGKEGKEENGGAGASTAKGTRIADDWMPVEADVEFAVSKGFSQQQIGNLAEHFASHHQSKGTLSKSWSASWRTWVMQDIRFHGEPHSRRRLSGGNAVLDACDDLIRQFGGQP